jgi:DNA repair exonuclease SbcCD ATPase subunit
LQKALKEIPTYELESLALLTTDYTNKLLSLYSENFSIKIITSLEKANSDGYKDVFKVSTFNNGDETLASNLSGGQKEIIDSALRMGIVLTLSDTQSKRFQTSFWDESDKSIDTASALKYIDMLEMSRVLGNKHFVIVISHRDEVQAATEQRIMVKDL